MTGLQHFDKEQKSNPQSHVSSQFHNSLGIISGSTRRKTGIISGAVQVAGSIPGVRRILRVLKKLRNEGTSFALQMARPLRCSDDHVKWRSRLQQ